MNNLTRGREKGGRREEGRRKEGRKEGGGRKEVFGMCSPTTFSLFTSYVVGILQTVSNCKLC